MCGKGKEKGFKLALIGLATMANEYYHWMTWPMFVGAVLLAVGVYKWFFVESEEPEEKAPVRRAGRRRRK